MALFDNGIIFFVQSGAHPWKVPARTRYSLLVSLARPSEKSLLYIRPPALFIMYNEWTVMSMAYRRMESCVTKKLRAKNSKKRSTVKLAPTSTDENGHHWFRNHDKKWL